MSKSIFHKTGQILLKPFRDHFLFLFSFFFLATSPYFLWYRISMRIIDSYIIYLIAHSFVYSYLVTLFISLIKPTSVRKAVQIIVLILTAIIFAVNFYCIFQLISRLDADIITLMLGTDVNEAKEFASVLVPKWIIFSVLGFYFFFIALWQISKRHQLNLGKKASKVAMGALGISIALATYNWKAWQDGPLKLFVEIASLEDYDDLQSHYTHPKITLADDVQLPSHVVLIIGESFARSHSSLYDYDKPTNPILSTYQDSLLLFTYKNIDSPAPTTANSIQLMLSTYSKADKSSGNSKKWYEYTTIIEMMQDCGYHCYWLSNQARINKHNGIARIFAEACNTQWFSGSENHDYILIDSAYQLTNQPQHTENQFIIYHLVGSHFDYSKRYPKEFAKFSENDYLSEPLDHRGILASYDNSILYNDYVVSRIMKLYNDKDAIVVYVPDHGQVMYRDPNSPGHFAHGKMDDKMSYELGIEIPFMIYASKKYQEKHPEIMQRIRASQAQNKPWNTDDLPYLLMDLIGVKDVGGKSVRLKSILN